MAKRSGGRVRVEVTGHRGAALVEPENTLRGLRYALSLGVDRVEVDVHLSRDNELIVLHDASVDRTTDGTGKVGDLTLGEIKKLDAGRGERVPTLQEVIEACREFWSHTPGAGGKAVETLLQIELKGEGTSAPTVAMVKRLGVEGRVVLTSFDAGRVAQARDLLPQAVFGLLSSLLDPDPIPVALQVGASAVHLRHDLATREWVERVGRASAGARAPGARLEHRPGRAHEVGHRAGRGRHRHQRSKAPARSSGRFNCCLKQLAQSDSHKAILVRSQSAFLLR